MPDRRIHPHHERAHGIEIDYCPTCRGVWLDRGELDKILDRAATQQPGSVVTSSAPAPRMQYSDDRSYGEHVSSRAIAASARRAGSASSSTDVRGHAADSPDRMTPSWCPERCHPTGLSGWLPGTSGMAQLTD